MLILCVVAVVYVAIVVAVVAIVDRVVVAAIVVMFMPLFGKFVLLFVCVCVDVRGCCCCLLYIDSTW